MGCSLFFVIKIAKVTKEIKVIRGTNDLRVPNDSRDYTKFI